MCPWWFFMQRWALQFWNICGYYLNGTHMQTAHHTCAANSVYLFTSTLPYVIVYFNLYHSPFKLPWSVPLLVYFIFMPSLRAWVHQPRPDQNAFIPKSGPIKRHRYTWCASSCTNCYIVTATKQKFLVTGGGWVARCSHRIWRPGRGGRFPGESGLALWFATDASLRHDGENGKSLFYIGYGQQRKISAHLLNIHH